VPKAITADKSERILCRMHLVSCLLGGTRLSGYYHMVPLFSEKQQRRAAE
jgi:hypothetical protein